jgi:hypothetical protein
LLYKPTTGNININSGSTSSIDGGIYAPSATVTFDSGSKVNTTCNQVVANSLVFNSGGQYGTACSNMPTQIQLSTGTIQVLVQ